MSEEDLRKKLRDMHRRAQKAEARLARIDAAYAISKRYADDELHRKGGGGWYSARHMFGLFMMTHFKSVWVKK